MNFKLRQLEGFLAAAEAKSFSSAAKSMSMTQPAFSQLIRELENLVGTRLFERTTRRVEITEAGHLLFAQARRPLEDLQHAYESLAELAAGRLGVVRFAILPSAAFNVGTKTIARFCTDFPGVKVQQIEDQDELLIEKVLNREVDFGVGMFGKTHPALSFDLLFEDELVVIMRLDHPHAAKAQIAWNDFKNTPLILLPPPSSVRRLVEGGLAVAGCQRDPTFEVVNMVTALSMVREGLGVTVLPKIALDALKMDGLVYRRFSKPRPVRRVGVIRLADRDLSTATETFIRYLFSRESPTHSH